MARKKIPERWRPFSSSAEIVWGPTGDIKKQLYWDTAYRCSLLAGFGAVVRRADPGSWLSPKGPWKFIIDGFEGDGALFESAEAAITACEKILRVVAKRIQSELEAA